MFKNYISLGWFCGPAASLENLGFRTASGPFDWYISEFRGVIDVIENNFENFLIFENLVKHIDSKYYFEDKKHGFLYNHESGIEEKQDYKYYMIKKKYQRRCDRFLKNIQEPTCLFRAIKDIDEIAYINENHKEIDKLFKRFNVENKVIYIVTYEYASMLCKNVEAFTVDHHTLCYEESIRLFEQSIDLVSFCIKNYDKEQRYKNMIYEKQKEINVLMNRNRNLIGIIENDLKIEKTDYILIYGAGKVGELLLDKLDKEKVLGFIDQYTLKETAKGFPVYRIGDEQLYECVKTKKCTIVITPLEFEDIKKNLKDFLQDLEYRAIHLSHLFY